MLEGSLSLFLMRLFSQMYKCHKPQKHYHKTWLHNSSASLHCVTRIYYILFLSALDTWPQAPPGPTHSSLSSLSAPLVILKQSAEGRVMACTLWLHKGRPGKQSFSSHHIIIRPFALMTRESRRGEIWQHRHWPGSAALITSRPALGNPCLWPCPDTTRTVDTLTLIQAVLASLLEILIILDQTIFI